MLLHSLGWLTDAELLRALGSSEGSPLLADLTRRLAERIDEIAMLRVEVSGLQREAKRLSGVEAADLASESSYLASVPEQTLLDLAEHRRDPLILELADRLRCTMLRCDRPRSSTSNGRKTHRAIALELLPNDGDSMRSYTLSKRLAQAAGTTDNVAGNTIRKLVREGAFRAEGRGAKRIIYRA